MTPCAATTPSENRSISSSSRLVASIASPASSIAPVLSRMKAFRLDTRVSNRKAFILDKTGAMDEAGLAILATRRELEEIERFSLGVVAAHGVIDPVVKAGTYISFSGVRRAQRKRTLAALDLIAPVLHSLFLQTKQAERSVIDLISLTDRQKLSKPVTLLK